MKMYTIYDSTIEKYFSKIFLLHNDAHAERLFQTSVLGGDEAMTASPNDYTLYRIGAYDDDTGIPIGHDPVRIQTGIQAMKNGMRDRERIQALHDEIHKLQTGDDNATH